MLSFSVAGRRFTAIFLCLSFLLFAGCRSNQPEVNQNTQIAQDEAVDAFDVPAPNINLSNPLVVSQKPEDVAMCAKVNEYIEKSPSANARWGVIAVSLKDGRVLCSRDGRKLFNPASIQKTLTAIVALDKLGADFRWKTSVYSANQIDSDGTLNGDLVIYGEGAPDFDNDALEKLAVQLQEKGLKRVKGNIVGDDSYFRGDTIGDGWTWNELQWYYGAEASALSINENQAFVNVENGEGRANTSYLNVTVGKPTPINNANRNANYEAGGIKRGLDNNEFYVWGNTNSFGARVSVHNPAGLVAKNLRESLEKKGITFDGETMTRSWRSADALDVSKAQELASVESQTLGEAVRRMNKHSVNIIAELLLRTIGKKFGTEIPDGVQLPQNVRGDDISGAAYVRKWLLEHKIAADEVQISDGSGLSRLDFVTPEIFARAFIYAAQNKFAEAFTNSLPIGGTDGTLGGRFGKVKGRVLAKTGTISFVNSLTGYAQKKDGEIITFAVIVNNETRKKGGVGIIDTIVLKMMGEDLEEKDGSAETNSNKSQNTNANANANANKPNFVLENGKK
ncbi:MAG TPA: D-alanyl-D-alanine carboxypeptidase/D-alanyl-D-alanine-endopeptidase [Pyrinomonadaceae bacterium]|nr:D-alanyl-D-alanine carboxypeptidase/D-alanyl-D-alanine-endopeptidase [Pyrinomonadaceae bacterium]